MKKKVFIESLVKDFRSQTRIKYSVEVKILIVFEGLHGHESIDAPCRFEGIVGVKIFSSE